MRSVAFSLATRVLAIASHDITLSNWENPEDTPRVTLTGLSEAWVTWASDGRYKFGGDPTGAFYYIIGLCSFEPGELDAFDIGSDAFPQTNL